MKVLVGGALAGLDLQVPASPLLILLMQASVICSRLNIRSQAVRQRLCPSLNLEQAELQALENNRSQVFLSCGLSTLGVCTHLPARCAER